ncbi:TRAP transporter permease [bacterium]|nr:TRAP transporter permease [bacterium]
MAEIGTSNHETTEKSLDKLIVDSESGTRRPGGYVGKLLILIPFTWSLFQLWLASPLPFIFNFGVFNGTEARSIHLAFAVFLAFTAFPALKRSPRDYIPVQDWLLALGGAFAAAYIYIFYEGLSQRSGLPTTIDITVSIIGMLILLEATRRALGPPLMVVAIVFLTYTFAGPYMPDIISHKGQSLYKVSAHQWLSTEGVFGVALGVSTSFVFLFVLFGSLLEKAGAGNYFIKTSFSLLGHMRGGPAKAAVVASGVTGIISGSSIANVATTGVFTIPLMKRVGFPASKAAAVEVAASTNGQLTPPVMGAAAFLMVEYVGITYLEVIKHAILPALISYIALVYIVHLESCKANIVGLPRRVKRTILQSMLSFVGSILGMCIMGIVVYYGIGWLKNVFGEASVWIVAVLVLAAYIGLLKFASRYPELKMDDVGSEILELPEPGPTIKVGLYYLIPLVVLMWCLIVERFSPGLSAFWATVLMIFISLTQRPIFSYFRGKFDYYVAFRQGVEDVFEGMVNGGRNMIGIGVATAAAGIVVGTVTLTGIGQVMIELVEFISGGNIMLILLFTAVICLILGMGLPTTANYIVVSTLMAPVIVELGAEAGLVVPLIAVHMFVFFFGILADDTPPVGLAAFAASAIAKSDPIKTGIQGFMYDIRTAILPFMFIFNTQLLLIGIDSIFELLLVIASAVTAMLLFAAATQGYWLTNSRKWETVMLLLIAFTLFRPGFWWDKLYPPYIDMAPAKIYDAAENIVSKGRLQIVASGLNIEGDFERKAVTLPMGESGSGRARIEDTGLMLSIQDDGIVIIDNVAFDSIAQKVGLDFDWKIEILRVESDRPSKHIAFIPALLMLTIIWALQRRRRKLTDLKTV